MLQFGEQNNQYQLFGWGAPSEEITSGHVILVIGLCIHNLVQVI
jgi:hypothetical protein